MSGANLNGYSDGKDGIHKLEMQRRIDALEDQVETIMEMMLDLSTKPERRECICDD